MSQKRKRKKKGKSGQSSPSAVKQPEPQKKSGNALWWLLGIALCAALGLTFHWLLNADFRTERSKHKIDPVKEVVLEEKTVLQKTLEKHTPLAAQTLERFMESRKDLVEHIGNSEFIDDASIRIFSDISPEYGKKVGDFITEALVGVAAYTWEGIPFKDLCNCCKCDAIGTYLTKIKKYVYATGRLDLKDFQMYQKNGKTEYTVASSNEDADHYLISHLLETGNGNCSTLPLAFVMIAQRLGLPVKLVTIADHQFCRFDSGTEKFNIEGTSPKAMGVGTPDSFYRQRFPNNPAMLLNSTTMKSQNMFESISSMYVSKMAYLSLSNASEQEQNEAVMMSFLFDPNSIYGIHNFYSTIKKMNGESGHYDDLLKELDGRLVELGLMQAPPDPELTAKLSEVTGNHKKVGNKIKSFIADYLKHKKTVKKIDDELLNLQLGIDPKYPSGGNSYQRIDRIAGHHGKRRQQLLNEYHSRKFNKKRELDHKKIQLESAHNKQVNEMHNLVNSVTNGVKEILPRVIDPELKLQLMIIQKENEKQVRTLQRYF